MELLSAATAVASFPFRLIVGTYDQMDCIQLWLFTGAVVAVAYAAQALAQNKREVLKLRRLVFKKILGALVAQGTRSSDAATSDSLKTWLLSDKLENGKHDMGMTVSIPEQFLQQTAEQERLESLKVAILSALFVVLQRRRFKGVTLGVRSSPIGKSSRSAGQEGLHTLEVELEQGMTFRRVTEMVSQMLSAARSTSSSDTEAEVVLNWSQAADERRADEWSAWIDSSSGSMKSFVMHAPSLEEEQCFKHCFEELCKLNDMEVWGVNFTPASTLELVKRWGTGPKTFAEFKDSSDCIRPVHEIVLDWHGESKAVSLLGPDFSITYQEMHQRAAAISCGIQAESTSAKKSNRVLLCMDRGEAIGPSLLGIWHAGYVAVPVDIHWPETRIQQVAQDAEIGLALVEPATLSLVSGLGLKVIVVNETLYSQYPGQQLARITAKKAQQEDPALVLFTSGSTGKPKGIVLSHGYITTLVAGIAISKQMSASTRALCFHSPTWMPFLDYQLAPLLVGGACLYYQQKAGQQTIIPSELNKFAKQHGASSAGFVPAVLDIFIDDGIPSSFTCLGCGGAPVPTELFSKALSLMPSGAMLCTGYNGTEIGDVTQVRIRNYNELEDSKHEESGFLTAGRPHTAQHMVIVDAGFKAVGVDAIGEVLVSGPGIASGYLNLPEKSAQTFIQDCSHFKGQVAVRSGDLAKWTSTGQLKPLGRSDSMVKVRGARIELSEVEGTVQLHPDVKTAVVIVHEDKLVAYVEPAVPADLKRFCQQNLVSYMVPHIFQGIDEIPRMPNGKVNKKELPKPEASTDGSEVVMELDSLGQMRKFTRKAASEDKILDNVRAILIGVVIHSHAIPLHNSSQMYSAEFAPLLGQHWASWEILLLKLVRGGGWSSLAFLSGFDDTRAMRPYGFTYREPLFIALWLLLDFNWTMWYLPVFVYMRAVFCAMHHIGLERAHMVFASMIWIIGPAFLDMYIGWTYPEGSPQPFAHEQCPSHCTCPWQEFPWAQTVAHYLSGWWVAEPNPVKNSFVGKALIFIPCYWIGFYQGGKVFKILTKIADDRNIGRRACIAAVALGLYFAAFTLGEGIAEGFNDRCSSFWTLAGSFVWTQVGKNMLYYCMNLSMSLLYVVVITALVPVHLKYLSKVCFASLTMSGLIPGVIDTPSQVAALRSIVSSRWIAIVETFWIFYVPFLFELVAGAIVTTVLARGVKAMIALFQRFGRKNTVASK